MKGAHNNLSALPIYNFTYHLKCIFRRRDYKNFEYLTGYHDLTPLQLVVKYNEWDLVMDLMPILPYNLKKYYHPIKYDLY